MKNLEDIYKSGHSKIQELNNKKNRVVDQIWETVKTLDSYDIEMTPAQINKVGAKLRKLAKSADSLTIEMSSLRTMAVEEVITATYENRSERLDAIDEEFFGKTES